MSDLYKNVQALNARGLRTFPLQPESKIPAVRFTVEATADPEQNAKWFGPGGRYASCNYGVLTDGLVVVDLDVKSKGRENMVALKATHPLTETLCVETATGGHHVYYSIPAGADPAKYGNCTHLFGKELKLAGVLSDVKKTGIDLRSFHGYVVGPGSSINGKAYVSQNDIEIADAPAWLLAAAEGASRVSVRRDAKELTHANMDVDQGEARARAIEYLKRNEADIESVKGAGGDDMAYKVACRLRGLGCTYDTACELMRSEHWGDGYGWSPKLEAKPIRNAYIYGQNVPGSEAGMQPSDFAATTTQPVTPEQQAEGEKIRDAALYRLNEEYAMVSIAGKVVIMRELGADADSLIEYQSPEGFRYWTSGETIASLDGKKMVEIADEWLRWSNRRRYERIVFLPGQSTPKGAFNLWRGFAVDPKPGDWSRLKAHILGNICSGDGGLCEYVLNWMAHAVQRPGEPGHVALVLRGKRGTGKGKLAETLGALFGPHFVHASKPGDVVGTFNAHLEHTSLLFADEAFFAGDKVHEGELKRIITEPKLMVEQKFLPKRQVPNKLHIVMASNEAWVIPAGLDERRFTVINVGTARQQDHPYFQAIDQQMKVEGGRAAMLHELLERDLSDFEPRRAYQTAALTEQKLHSLGPIDKWLHECLDAAEIACVGTFGQEWASAAILNIEKNRLWKAFDEWQGKGRRYSRHVGHVEFWKRMRELFGDRAENRQRVNGVPTRHFTLPALTEARALFAKEIGGRPDWTRAQTLGDLL